MSPSKMKPGKSTDSGEQSTKEISTVTSLSARLKEQSQKTRLEAEKIWNDELETLSENLNQSVGDVLSSTLKDIRHEAGMLKLDLEGTLNEIEKQRLALTKKASRKWTTAIIWMILFIAGGSAVIGVQKITTLAPSTHPNPSLHLADQWNLNLNENQNGRWIVLPPGHSLQPGYAVGDQEALKLITR